jgi:hypothetical protein
MDRSAEPGPDEGQPDEGQAEESRPDEGEHHERPVDRWRQNTASGAVVAAFALGFQQVFDPERKGTIGVEQPVSTDPVDVDGLELRFDPLSTSETVVVVRPPAKE